MKHVQNLMQEYEREHGDGSMVAKMCRRSDGHTSQELLNQGQHCDESRDHASEALGWGGEEYEEDNLRGVEGAYLKFASRLGREPAQCVR